MRNFCVLCRPRSHKLKDFLPIFEDVPQFLRILQHDTKSFGDFTIDAIKDSKHKSDYENLIPAFCFRRQISEPSRVTPTSSTCLDYLLTSFPVKHETIKTTFSDQYTVVGEIHIDIKNSQQKQQFFFKTRNLKNIKGDKAVSFLFLLGQKLMKLEENLTIDNISRTILDCVHRFAPERFTSHKNSPSNHWINNSNKNAKAKRDILFQQQVNDPKQENREIYKRQGNLVTSLISNRQSV